MSRLSAVRIALAFVLVISIAVPCAQAGEPGSPRLSDLLDRAWAGLVSLWAENGCIVDPNGRCASDPQPTADNGCIADPDGRCVAEPRPAADNGCIADPNGACRSGS